MTADSSQARTLAFIATQLGASPKGPPKGRGPWAMVNRELVDKILEDEALPERLASWSPEDHLSGVSFVIEELLGLHRATWKPVQETTETILRLAEIGNVVLVGRAANLILSHLPQAFHVRLVASLERRVASTVEQHGVSKKAALAHVQAEDRARQRFIRRYFQVDITDPLHYNLVVNVDRTPIDEAARIVGDAVLARAERST